MNLKEIIFELLDIIPELWHHPDLKTEVIVGAGYVSIKTRDPREPMRMEKIRTERKIRALMIRRLQRQLEMLQFWGIQKAKPRLKIDLPEWEDDDFIDELIAIIFAAGRYGIELFEDQVGIGLDYTLANARALTWAREYTFKLVKGIDDTTVKILQEAVSSFIETPGFNIGDIIDQLTQMGFTEKRASTIAVTETTRAFAEGQMQAAREFQSEFPGFTVLKLWQTNNDDRVCDICGAPENGGLNGGVEVPIGDAFPSGDMEPPAHPNCRCWITYYTKEARDALRE